MSDKTDGNGGDAPPTSAAADQGTPTDKGPARTAGIAGEQGPASENPAPSADGQGSAVRGAETASSGAGTGLAAPEPAAVQNPPAETRNLPAETQNAPAAEGADINTETSGMPVGAAAAGQREPGEEGPVGTGTDVPAAPATDQGAGIQADTAAQAPREPGEAEPAQQAGGLTMEGQAGTPSARESLDAGHWRELGMDSAIGEFRQGEAETAARIEEKSGVRLERFRAGQGPDWVGPDGETYDAVGNFDAQYFDQQWDNLQVRIQDHLDKADYVVVDVSKFTADQTAKVREFTQQLDDRRIFLVGDD